MKVLGHLSGGFDSVAACVRLLEDENEVMGVFFDLGQPYLKQEAKAVAYASDFFTSKYPNWLGCRTDNVAMELQRAADGSPSEYIPVRNLVLAAHSANIALAEGFNAVAVGSKTVEARPDDDYSFNECSIEFFEKVTDVVSFCSEGGDSAEFIMPLIENRVPLTKGKCVQLILNCGLDLTRLWSCYEAEGQACGKCYHCKELMIAFDEISYDYSGYFLG